ncbi:sporulation membrane protein YtrI [Aquibacillus saliphilus]|uniref:sporulation membrane protein YtrI n=1 Tax=Aquibacillus saliphilus TaxID=1909422 RepID=UPI0034E1A363
MHIPPYYKKESWQRFFAGTFIGAIIAFVVFTYMYGQFYERWVEENLNLRSQLNELENKYEILEDSKRELDEKSKEKITVNTIEVKIDNEKQLKLDSLIVHQLEELIREQIKDVVGKDINSLAENYKLLTSTIESKTYKVEGFTYNAKVKQMFVTSTININIEITISN